jgi:hypothetical protein
MLAELPAQMLLLECRDTKGQDAAAVALAPDPDCAPESVHPPCLVLVLLFD